MSVAHLTAEELGTFVAIAHTLGKGPIDELVEMAELMSRSNSAAYTAQYDDVAEPASASSIEIAARLAIMRDELMGHFGPIVYNCLTNAGELYYGELPADVSVASTADVRQWRAIEKACREWQDAKLREQDRAEENAVAFDDVGRLRMKSADELRALMGDGALIVAEFCVNESDMQTDYHGGRTTRRVVIGVRKSKRESFVTLRKAAAGFPPTAEYGPGNDLWSVYSWRENRDPMKYQDRETLRDDHYRQMQFATQAEAESYVENLIATAQDSQPGYIGALGFAYFAKTYGVEYHKESLEHRENWSMGGGNYLGSSRYGGWKVRSLTYVDGPMECSI